MKRQNISTVILTFFFVFLSRGSLKIARAEKVKVMRAVSGNAVMLGNGEVLYYVGVVIPDKGAKYITEAADYNSHIVTIQKAGLGGVVGADGDVRYDMQLRNANKSLVGYLFVNHLFINAAIITEGYGLVHAFPPNLKYQKLLNKTQVHARENKRGLWANITPYDGNFVASKETKFFYRANTKEAKAIPPDERVEFDSFAEALENAYNIDENALP